MAKVENRLAELLARKQRIEKRRISRRRMAEETGISFSSIQGWATNAISRYDALQIAVFCDYLGCGVEELLVIVEDDESPEIKTELPLAV